MFDVLTTDVLFNQYRDSDPSVDVDDAAPIRRQNLASYLDAFPEQPDLLVLAEAPGPWGCRFSGVPITAEAQLLDTTFPVNGRRSSREGAPHCEYSAGIFWKALAPAFPRFFVWNTVPWHPHHRGKPLSIRTPSAEEIARGSETVEALYNLLRPRRTLALGRKAEGALGRIGVACTYVRHPSQGGARNFSDAVSSLLADNPDLIRR